MAGIKKRGNSYLITVSLGYDANGRQIAKTRTWKPASNMTERQIEKELSRQAMQFEDRVKNGIETGEKNIKLFEFINQYKAITKNTLSPTTYAFYQKIIDNHIIPQLGHLKIQNIKPFHTQEFVNYLISLGISASTVSRYLNVLQSIMRLAVKQDLIINNPASTERLEMPKKIKPEITIFTKQEAGEMIRYLEQEDLQFQVLIQLAVITGARRGELIALTFDDIDFINHKININKSAYKIAGKHIDIKPPKDYESRTVSIGSEIIDLIKILKVQKGREADKLGDVWKGENWLFTRWNGDIMDLNYATRHFSKFLENNNLKHRKFHSLRHTSATLLLYSGINIKHVAQRLGHANIDTTNKYLHYIADADEEASNVLQDMLITHIPEKKISQK